MEPWKLVLYPHTLLACTALLGMSYVHLWRLLLELLSKVGSAYLHPVLHTKVSLLPLRNALESHCIHLPCIWTISVTVNVDVYLNSFLDGLQVLDRLDFNDSTVQHVMLASIPPQDTSAVPAEVVQFCSTDF